MLWNLCLGSANAATTYHLMLGGISAPFDLTEDAAAADLIGYQVKPYTPRAHLVPAPHQGDVVTIVRLVPSSIWFNKYHAMVQATAARGIAEPKHPDDSDLEALVEIKLADGRTAWVSSAALYPDPAR